MDYLLFLLLLALSGFFSSVETAYFSLSDVRVRVLREKKRHGAELVARLKSEPNRLLVTILIGNNVVNLFMAAYAAYLATEAFGSAGVGIATGVSTLFILIFGEIMPKSFAYAHNVKIALLAARPLTLLSYLLMPISTLLLYFDRLVHRLFGAPALSRVTETEIRTLSRLGVEHGAIEYREHEMIENVFRFDDVAAGDIMTPMYRVKVLNGAAPIEQVAYFAAEEGFSRYPVEDDNYGDTIIGYIHVNDIMLALNSDRRDRPVSEFASPVTSVPEDRKVERIFRAMKRDQSHLALVYRLGNEKEIIGIITLEDILEEIVGEIEDETDR